MEEFAISVSNISKCYKSFANMRSRLLHSLRPGETKGLTEIWALRDVSFNIAKGESVAIIGRNGGGKSTLLEILTGTLTPTSGAVTVNGRVCALLELGSGFNPEYSGRDNVILNGLLLGLTKDQILSRFDEIEAFAEIGAAIDRPVKTYSSGMMLRLAFAVQVLSDPDILIIDEALSVGDFFFQQKCFSYIRRLKEKGVTLLFVSHDMSIVRDLCSKGIFLRSGIVDFYGANLEAARRYLADGAVPSGESLPVPRVADANENANEQGEWFWSAEAGPQSVDAKLLAVDILDESENRSTSLKMGSQLIVRTLFVVFRGGRKEITVALKNRHGHLVTAIGSYTLKTPFPDTPLGVPVLSEIKIKMALEAGGYSLSVTLAEPSPVGTAGTSIQESPWLGPIQIDWPYHEEIPPFYGMVGLEATSVFLPAPTGGAK